MTTIILLVFAVVPSLLLMLHFHRRDVNPEPRRVLWATFGWGVASVFPILAVAIPMQSLVEGVSTPLWHGFFDAFLLAAIPEELFKFLVLMLFVVRRSEFDEPMDGIVYGATASLGFATLENVLYVTNAGMGTAILRAITAVPGHAFLGAIMGYFVGQAAFGTGEPRRALFSALFWPILLHGLYDFPLLAEQAEITLDMPGSVPDALLLLVPITLGIELVWSRRMVARLRADQLAAGGPVDEPVPRRRPERTSLSHLLGWVLTVMGWSIAGSGGLAVLLLALAFLTGSVDPADRKNTLIGGAVLGLVPLWAGIMLILAGRRRRRL